MTGPRRSIGSPRCVGHEGAVRRLIRPARRLAARVYAEVVAAEVRATLRRLIRSGRPVLVGPWLGEVGFELLYWVPFLRWVVEDLGLDPARVVIVSRGGPESWYRGLGARYLDLFDQLEPQEFRHRNEWRRQELGEQKQRRLTAFDNEMVGRFRRELGESQLEVLHPSLMYRVMQPYWWRHVPTAWVRRHMRFAPLTASSSRAQDEAAHGLSLPSSYVAVKFYFNDCFASTPENRAFIASTVQALAKTCPVVSLSTGLEIDDHGKGSSVGPNAARVVEVPLTPRNNLAVQTTVVAGARKFVGTYGGFAYLAPFVGVPATAVWSDQHGFDPRHLKLVQQALSQIDGGQLRVTRAADAGVCGSAEGTEA